MKYLVVDVAAEHGGALSVLNQFVRKFKSDTENEYIVYVSNLDFEDTENVKFFKAPWVKRSKIHRMYFDSFFVKKLIKMHSPDRLFSLQNKGFKVKNLKQDVYFHNALFICEKRFSFKESRKLWMYQNIISKMTRKSLTFADRVFVQAEWIKSSLANKWKIEESKIFVDRPDINTIFKEPSADASKNPRSLFFPANYSAYKNHRTLFCACAELWEERGKDTFSLLLTGKKDNVPTSLKAIFENRNYPIEFLGSLSAEEMKATYEKSILVFPSYIETVGLPLVEARCLSRPIIAADCEYARESVGEYDKVSYFSPFDVESLKIKILEKTVCK